MTFFERGQPIRVRLTTKDFDGNVVIPTETPTCKIFNSDNPQDPIATLTVETYGTGQYQAYWAIPTDVEIGKFVYLPKLYYAEWSWKWEGFDLIERVPFNVLQVEVTPYQLRLWRLPLS